MSAPTAAPVGTELPPGSVVIHDWEDIVLRDTIAAPERRAPEPHPLWALTGALRGLATDIQGILALVDFPVEDGPLFATCDMEYLQPLAFGVPYDVTGRILGLEAKVGRRTGPFDLFTFALELARDGATVTRVTFVWVLPREEPRMTRLRIASVSAEGMRVMALLHGDGNPIHLDPATTAEQGLGDRVINPGGANLGYVLNAVQALEPGARLERITVTFGANVFAEDDVTAEAEVTGREDGRITAAVRLDVAGGTRALEGTATLRAVDG